MKFATIAEEICFLRAENEDLKARLREATAPVGREDPRLPRLMALLRLPLCRAAMALALIDRGTLTRAQLRAAAMAAGNAWADNPKIVDVQLVYLRKAGLRLECRCGLGAWTLHPEDRRRWREALAAPEAA